MQQRTILLLIILGAWIVCLESRKAIHSNIVFRGGAKGKSSKKKAASTNTVESSPAPRKLSQQELSEAILSVKLSPNSLICDNIRDEYSDNIILPKAKYAELNLKEGDLVSLKGKKQVNLTALHKRV